MCVSEESDRSCLCWSVATSLTSVYLSFYAYATTTCGCERSSCKFVLTHLFSCLYNICITFPHPFILFLQFWFLIYIQLMPRLFLLAICSLKFYFCWISVYCLFSVLFIFCLFHNPSYSSFQNVIPSPLYFLFLIPHILYRQRKRCTSCLKKRS